MKCFIESFLINVLLKCNLYKVSSMNNIDAVVTPPPMSKTATEGLFEAVSGGNPRPFRELFSTTI